MAERTCSAPDCSRPHYARGWCGPHYNRIRAHGDPQLDKPLRKLPTAAERQDLPGRIAANFIIREDGCWEWQGEIGASGYAQLSWRGRRRGQTRTVHRLAWENFVGRIPAGDEWTLDHLCHTEDDSCPGGTTCPHRRCVNPDHLEVVTRGENSRRGAGWQVSAAVRKARVIERGTCVNGHPLDRTYRSPDGRHAYCRDCRNARLREQRAA